MVFRQELVRCFNSFAFDHVNNLKRLLLCEPCTSDGDYDHLTRTVRAGLICLREQGRANVVASIQRYIEILTLNRNTLKSEAGCEKS